MFENARKNNAAVDITGAFELRSYYRAHKFFSWKKTIFCPTTAWFIMCLLLLAIIYLTMDYARNLQNELSLSKKVFSEAHQMAQKRLEEKTRRLEQLMALESSGLTQTVETAQTISNILNTASGDRRDFLEKLVPEALKIGVTYSIPPSAIVGMSTYETSYGTSQLCREFNNYFGIKARAEVWEGTVAENIFTRDLGKLTRANFRSYPDMRSSIVDYAEFVSDSDRYKEAFSKKSGQDFVKILNVRGYCPDKDYAKNVAEIIKRHHLDLLDDLAVTLAQTTSTKSIASVQDTHLNGELAGNTSY